MYVTDELLDVIAGSRRIVPYIDIPLQHVNDTMLRRMQRRVTRQETIDLIGRLRARIPGVALRTTFITGFPGETDEQFEELVEFVRQARFERIGVFTYSNEPDTPSARLPDHLDEETKQARRNRLMESQQQIAFEYNQAQLGQTREVLIDAAVPGEKRAWIGRTQHDAPDIDSVVYVSGKNLKPGQFVDCEIVATKEYDLIGAAVGKPR
jgi:ribosomal protein S12 methylthiotransferase